MGKVTNPFGPTIRHHEPVEVVDHAMLDPFLLRLEQLGATEAELAGVRDNWDQLDEDWTAERREQFALSSDADLVAAIEANRREHRVATHTDDELADATARAEAQAALRAEATEARQGNVASVLEWVGGDLDRAGAMLALEHADGSPRSTLVTPLEAMLQAAALTAGPSATALTGHVGAPAVTAPEATHEPA